MTSDAHDLLVQVGAKWLRKQGFQVVTTEIAAAGCREQPDVIGFRSTCSVIIEAKVSRSDFLADLKKPERTQPGAGLGVYRFYICPPALLHIEDLPAKWGLLYAKGAGVEEVYRPQGNIWPGIGTDLAEWRKFQHVSDIAKERAVLFSIARRLSDRRRARSHFRTKLVVSLAEKALSLPNPATQEVLGRQPA